MQGVKKGNFRTFKRTWWIENPSWPKGLEPCAGDRAYFKGSYKTEAEARAFCQEWNRTHKPGRLSLKAEYEQV